MRPDAQQLKWLGGLVAISIAINIAGIFYAFSNVYKPYESQNLTNLAAIDLSRDTVDPDFRVGIGTDGGGGQISAGDYKAAVERYGRPDLSEDDLTSASREDRTGLDQTLVLALPVQILPAAALTPDRREVPRCLGRSGVAAGDRARFIPPLHPAGADRSHLPGSVRPGTGRAGMGSRGRQSDRVPDPADRSDRPWRIGFKGSGKVTVCPAMPAGA